eukprot:scaffold73634_cov57-Phaeocystis_antarctica.AAC.4
MAAATRATAARARAAAARATACTSRSARCHPTHPSRRSRKHPGCELARPKASVYPLVPMPWARAALKHASAVWISMQSLRTPQLASPLLSTSIGGRGGEGSGDHRPAHVRRSDLQGSPAQ